MTRPLPALARSAVDRDAAARLDDEALDAAWEQARVLVLDEGRVLVAEDAGQPALVLVPAADAPGGERFYLGRDDDGPLFAVSGSLPRRLGASVRDLRAVGAQLPAHDAGLLVHAVALANWHAAHPRCPRCGTETTAVRGGAVRLCPEDGSEHFPRVDPAMIVLVHDGGDRCVLGRQAVWPPGRFSTLAGFVEPGESVEQAVVREVHEETGLQVEAVTYVASQPWPFPSSLMLGFTATCDGSAEPQVVDGELDEVRWFTRQELRDAATWGQGSGLQLPGEVSIARFLIDGWLSA